MKRIYFVILILGFSCLFSCKSDKEKAKEIVNEFLKQINDDKIKKRDIDYTFVSNDFKNLFLESYYYTSEKWILSVNPKSDTSFLVKSTGNTFNGFGQPVENHQEFEVCKINGEFKIINSYKLIEQFLDFQVVDNNWDFFWDIEKSEILKQLKEKLILEVLVLGSKNKYGDYVQGKLKLINNSDYDIQGVKILIEHYDNQGNSVNSSYTYVSDIIRNHGYREFNWLNGDCSKCEKQEFKINFITESH